MAHHDVREITRRTRELYDRHALGYAGSTQDYNRFPGLREEVHRFSALAVPELQVVDLGCGAGRDSRYLLELGHEVVALDLSDRMLAATGAYCARHPRLNLVQADLSRTPFREASIGGVWACASLVHVPARQLRRSLEEIRRILVPGAGVSMSMKAGEGEGWQVGETLAEARWFTFVQPDEFASLLGEHGFVEVSATSSGRREWFVAEGRRA